jgi:hypothetical protein
MPVLFDFSCAYYNKAADPSSQDSRGDGDCARASRHNELKMSSIGRKRFVFARSTDLNLQVFLRIRSRVLYGFLEG